MKSRDAFIRLQRYKADEKRRHVDQIESMIAEFERMARDLDEQVRAEEERSGIRDTGHFAYPTFAKAAIQRRPPTPTTTAVRPHPIPRPRLRKTPIHRRLATTVIQTVRFSSQPTKVTQTPMPSNRPMTVTLTLHYSNRAIRPMPSRLYKMTTRIPLHSNPAMGAMPTPMLSHLYKMATRTQPHSNPVTRAMPTPIPGNPPMTVTLTRLPNSQAMRLTRTPT